MCLWDDDCRERSLSTVNNARDVSSRVCRSVASVVTQCKYRKILNYSLTFRNINRVQIKCVYCIVLYWMWWVIRDNNNQWQKYKYTSSPLWSAEQQIVSQLVYVRLFLFNLVNTFIDDDSYRPWLSKKKKAGSHLPLHICTHKERQ